MEIEKLDIDSMFVKYTINEIRDIEEQIKIDMEKKKEELRSMVGERYRDLIEAADAIFEMKNCAKGVEDFVHLLNERCSKVDHKLPTTTSIVNASNSKIEKQSNKITLAIALKILAEARRRCWIFIEEHNFKEAARQYLFAQHTAASFLSSGSDEPLDGESRNSIIAATRLWQQTRPMKNTILEKARLYLKRSDANVSILANVLSTLIAFGNKNVEQALDEFLNAKLDAIRDAYQNNDISHTSKDNVHQLLMLFINGIFELDSIFSENVSDTECFDLLKSNLETFFSPNAEIDLSRDENHLSFVQQQILSMENTFFKNCEPIDLHDYQRQREQIVRPAIEKWLDSALDVVRTGLKELFNHVTTLKSLLNLKTSLVSLMTETRMQQWGIVCARLFQRKDKEIQIWTDLIKVELRIRAKEVLKVRFEQFRQTAVEKIGKSLEEFQKHQTENETSHEFHILDYVWSDVDNQIPSDYVWTPSTSRIPIGDAKYSLKSVAVSMDLQNLCRQFDDELRQILDDVQEFSTVDGSSANDTSTNSTINYSDSGFVEEHLEESLLQFCSAFIERLRHMALENERNGNERRTCSSLIWLGCCARSIPIVCKNLKNSFELVAASNETLTSPIADRKLRALSQAKKTSDKSEKSSWLKSREMFVSAHIDFFKQWIIHLCAHVDMQLHKNLHSFLDDLPSVLWDEIEIEETLETDKKYKSVIRVPMYPSPFIEETLFYACEQINRSLAHGIEKEISNELALRLLQTFFNVYDSWWSEVKEKYTGKKRFQTRIIQLVYDLRFVQLLLERKENISTVKEVNERFSKLIEMVETDIDPFDLNVLTPYMLSHLQKVIPRSALLFGHLITNERLIPSKPLPINSQEANNIFSLTSCSQRFSLLPIGNNVSNLSSNSSLASKGKFSKTNPVPSDGTNSTESNSDSSLSSFRPITNNVSEVATYYSKWFQNMVK